MMNIIKAREMQEGDGVTVRRLFPFQRDHLIADPFVLWDDFTIGAGHGFPTHAHRGFEAITYLFSGTMNHADNLGNNSTVTAGGAQRFTAGKGIQHSEMPGDTGDTTGIQLWINLPQSLKGIEPAYQQVDAVDIPETSQEGVVIREIVGAQSPLQLKTPIRYAELNMAIDSTYTTNVADDMQGVIYLQDGEISINKTSISEGEALQVSGDDVVTILARQKSRLMIALGVPHHEPVRLSGGYVD